MASLRDGVSETAAIGSEGFIGFEAVLGGETAAHRALVQLPGTASRLRIADLRAVMRACPDIRDLLLRYVRFFLVQALQSVACPFTTLYEGWAARARTLADGSRQILDILLPGDAAGLSAAVLRTRTCEILALTDVTLCVLDARQLTTLLRRYPALACSILDAQFRDQERADARLTALGRMGAGERIAYLLLDLREQLARRGMCKGKSAPFPLQRTHLADAVGLSKIHVMRALRELKRNRLLTIADQTLTIPDVRRLARYCGYGAALPRRACAIL